MNYIVTRFLYILSLVYNQWLNFLFRTKGIELGTGVLFNKKPIFEKVKGARITIGANTMINSNNSKYHLNMHSPCKFMADRDGAEVRIGSNSRIHGTCIHAYKSIIIGDNCLIAANTQILDSNGHLLSMENPMNRINTQDEGKGIIIGDNVWIGAGCTILGSTIIGEGAVISTGSVVKGLVPAKSIYGGNPAKIIKIYE